MAESEQQLKSLLLKVKEEIEKASLKLNIQNSMILASGPIISWQIDGEKVKTVTDCSHKIKRRLLLGRKAMINLLLLLLSLFSHV